MLYFQIIKHCQWGYTFCKHEDGIFFQTQRHIVCKHRPPPSGATCCLIQIRRYKLPDAKQALQAACHLALRSFCLCPSGVPRRQLSAKEQLGGWWPLSERSGGGCCPACCAGWLVLETAVSALKTALNFVIK